MDARLKKSTWLKRVVDISEGDKPIFLTYNGLGFGRETVSISGATIADYVENVQVSYVWFVPKFEIEHEGKTYIVEVRVWPWLTIRSFSITRDDVVIYSEGKIY